jgi:hypothetical protein
VAVGVLDTSLTEVLHGLSLLVEPEVLVVVVVLIIRQPYVSVERELPDKVKMVDDFYPTV